MQHNHGVGEDPEEHDASAPEPTGGAVLTAAAAAVGVAYGAWAVSLPPFSAAATVAVIAGGAAAMLWGGTGRRRTTGIARPPAAVWPWTAVAAATALWQLAAYLQHPRTDHPTLSSLTNAVLDSHPARALAFVAWLAAAAALARR